jgi:hypothetical protein
MAGNAAVLGAFLGAPLQAAQQDQQVLERR